jgi:predicted RNA-binding Zn-ribbon protein involved in translation (DUF1610 family)
MSEHGHCPNCGVDLDGGSIWQTFFDRYQSEAEADRAAEMYGATREKGQWGREIGIYDMNLDRTVMWQCPDCEHQWKR